MERRQFNFNSGWWPAIPNVPDSVYESFGSSLFRPRKISIGPYDIYEVSTLWEEKAENRRIVNSLFERVDKPLEEWVCVLEPMVDELFSAFSEDVRWFPLVSFLEMMVVDGCYLLEMMLESHELDYFEFVINCILDFFSLPRVCISQFDGCLHLLDVYRRGLLSSANNVSDSKRTNNKAQWCHILDIYQHCLHGAEAVDGSNQTDLKAFHFYVPSATELQGAQIGITTSKTSSLMDISFTDDKTLWLPQIHLSDMDLTISTFHNMALLEEFHPHAPNSLPSYIYFMKRLLKGAADNSLLQSRGVITTMLRDDEVVKLFDDLCKSRMLPPKTMEAKLLKVVQNLRDCYNKNSEPWRKDLFQTYLRSPWTIISVFAAVLIFSLTAKHKRIL